MKNIPEKIFLCIGDEIDIKDEIDFNELDEVLWSAGGINNNDIEYVLKSSLINRFKWRIGRQLILEKQEFDYSKYLIKAKFYQAMSRIVRIIN